MPTFVGGTHNSAASAATITATYSPTALNYVVVFVAVGGSVSGLSVQDNNGNYLIQGPCYSSAQIPVPGGTGYLFAFFGMAQTGATSYTANWTTNRVSSMRAGRVLSDRSHLFHSPSYELVCKGTSGRLQSAKRLLIQPTSWSLGSSTTPPTPSLPWLAPTSVRILARARPLFAASWIAESCQP